MSAAKLVSPSALMPDIYTCSVCGMKITLNVLTEHVLLHDQYSAFSYNETTKIIEPLDEVQEQLLQEKQVPVQVPPKVDPYPSSAFTYIPAINNYDLGNAGIVPNEYCQGQPLQYERLQLRNVRNVTTRLSDKTKSYNIAPNLEKKLSTAPLNKLKGIKMIANVAESLSRTESSKTNDVWIDELGRLNVEAPMNPGSVIGKIKLPFIGNVGEKQEALGIYCECSIVFDRFVSDPGTKDLYLDGKQDDGNAEMSLQDIIDGDGIEEDFGEEFVEIDDDFLKENNSEHQQVSVSKGGKPGRKMEVYRYKESEVDSKVQDELQKSIVTLPGLLKDPAVVKYLETMTGKPISEVDQTAEIQNTKELDRGYENDEDDMDASTISEKTADSTVDLTNQKNLTHEIESLKSNGENVHKEVAVEVVKRKPNKVRVFVKLAQIKDSSEVVKTGSNQKEGIEKSQSSIMEEMNSKQNEGLCTNIKSEIVDDDCEQEQMDWENNFDDDIGIDENVEEILSNNAGEGKTVGKCDGMKRSSKGGTPNYEVLSQALNGNIKLDGTSASEDTLTAVSDEEDRGVDEGELIKKRTSQRNTNSKYRVVRNQIVQFPADFDDIKVSEVSRAKTSSTDVNRKLTISKDYICENCGQGFLLSVDCAAHSEMCTESGKLKCFQGCGATFKTRSQLDYHKKFCSRRLSYLERINKEQRMQENSGQLGGLEGDVQEDNVQHVEEENGQLNINIEYECPFCSQPYLTEKKMTNHKLVCPNRPKQKCGHCSFQCKGDKGMAKHLVEVHNLKPFKCEECSRTFKLKGSLKDHVRSTHTKETFTCEFCGKSFIKQSLYRLHVSVQHEGFRLVCSYCGKKFKDKRTWVLHERSHKGAYEYACTMCKKTFYRSDSYKVHMKEEHSIDGEAALSLNNATKELRDKLCSNVCSVCKETFPLESAYDMHMMKVHGHT